MRPLFHIATQRSLLLGVGLLTLAGCGAVYPEMKTPRRPVPANYTAQPAPPAELLYVDFRGATIPSKTRDGRPWGGAEGSAPDPLAKLIVNGKDIIITPVQSNTLTPTWPNQVRGNYRIPLGASVTVQVWDNNAINNHPICTKKVGSIHADAERGVLEVHCPSGAMVTLNVRPADPLLGLGFDYELMGNGVVRVTKVVPDSPAGRAGIAEGAKITRLQGKEVKDLDALQVQSTVNANSRLGLDMDIANADGTVKHVKVQEAAMYLLEEQPQQ